MVLLVLIINTDIVQARNESFADLRSQVVRMENEVIIGKENRVEIKNSLEATEKNLVRTQGEAERVLNSLIEIEAGLNDLQLETAASRSHMNELKSDLKSLDDRTKQLASEQEAQAAQGKKVHEYVGEGQRQYLTGLKLGGKRILILLDASASMLDETIVNIIRLRNMGERQKRAAEKWQRAQGTAEWLISNFPEASDFQIYLFNTESRAAVQSSSGKWLSAREPGDISAAVKEVRQAVPEGGTSLYQAFSTAKKLKPAPDNILLITDGLPTQGRTQPTNPTVTAQKRLDHFYRAIKVLPRGVPINTILLPMEGDAYAAAAYWQLAVNTKGSFMTPSRDWP